MELNTIIQQRHSVRAYLQKAIPQTLLNQVIEAGRMAPSAVNFQPYRFYVVTQPQNTEALKASYPRPWFNDVPCIIVIVGLHDEAWKRKADDKDHTDIDCSIAIDHMTLKATEIGLGTCWICNFDVPKVHDFLQLNGNEEPIALLSIGFPSENGNKIVKKRKTMEEISVWM